MIGYSFLVTNSGNVSLAGPVTITDDKATDEACPNVNTVGNLDGFLDPGESITCTASYTITQADLNAGSVTNIAQAHAGGTDSNTDTETVTAVQSPALTLVKTATPTTYDEVGDVISYSFLLTNSGNVTLVAPFTITDDKALDEACPAIPTSLAPEDSITCTASYTITQTDLDTGEVTNTAQGHGFFGITPIDSNEDSETVNAIQNPALQLDKTGTFDAGLDGFADPGELITYTFVVTNTGNVTLTNVTVTDPLPGLSAITCDATTIPVGGFITCTATYAVTQDDIDAGFVYNLATADSDESGPDEDDNNEPLPQSPALTVEKSSTTTSLSAPATVTYSYLVTNTGNVTLTGISLSDDNDNDDMSCPFTTLAPAGTMTCTATHTFTQAELDAGGTLDNTVTASSNEAPDATDDLSIPITQNASMTVEKSSTTTSLSAPPP